MNKENKFKFIRIDKTKLSGTVIDEITFLSLINFNNNNLEGKKKNLENSLNELNKEIQDYKIYLIKLNKPLFDKEHFFEPYKNLNEIINKSAANLLCKFDAFLNRCKSEFDDMSINQKIEATEWEAAKHDESNTVINLELLNLVNYEMVFPLNILEHYKNLINDKINIISLFIHYKSLNEELNFDNCIIEPSQAIEFSRYIEKSNIKVIYLKYIKNIFLEKPLLSDRLDDLRYLDHEIKKIEDSVKLKNVDKVNSNTEKNNPDPTQEKTKRVKPLKKFEFNATYESIERVIQLLIKARFINPANSNNIGAILKDTIKKFNEESGIYEDIDNKTYNASISQLRDKNGVLDINKKPIDIKGNSDFAKFTALQKELNKIIPENKP